MIIDDEPLAIRLLEDHIGKIAFLQLTGSSTNPLNVMTSLNKADVDLVFLDIQMPQLSGVQIMEILRNRVMVIITSAYQEYAIDAFEHNVVDYLLKPVSLERFYRAAEKAYRQKFPTAITRSAAEFQPSTGGYIFVKVETKMVRVELDDICYIMGLKNYVSIFTRTQRIITLQTMKQLEEVLPANRFVRTHKSYFVALDKIISVEKQQIFIKDKIIPIGNTHLDNFLKVLDGLKA
jgi:DNA-binding LytR/AlgR family response regulator